MIVEKRKYARFVAPPNTFAALGKEYTRVGKIIDISQGGLALEYIRGEVNAINSVEVDIFLVGNVFQLYNVPCKIVYDIQIHEPHVNNNLVKLLTTKKCGIKFVELSEDINFQLKLFIDNHSEGFCK